jgi:hypothetical protein
MDAFDSSQPLAELLQAIWPHEKVLALFSDLAAGAEVQHVQLRTKTSDSTVTLADARAAFAYGDAIAIQVRYLFEGEHWSDTIMPGVPHTSIIRSRLPM